MKEQTFLKEVSKLVAGGEPLDAFYVRFCRLVQAELRASSVGISLREGDVLRNAYATGRFFADDARLVTVLYSGQPACTDREMLAPVQFGDRIVGVLWICAQDEQRFDPSTMELAEICALQLAVKIHDETISKAQSDLQVLAQTDGLTGLWNRSAFERRLMEEWNRASRGTPLSVLMIDIDFFKAFNDRYGHVAGDVALRQVSAVLKSAATRPTDMAARYGGEEFAIILAGTDNVGAVAVGEKIRQAVTDAAIAHALSTLRLVSISIGIASRDDGIATAWELIEAADRALYRAKESGRNRVAAPEFVSQTEPALLRYERRDNLPAQMSRFIGRDAELSDLRARLSSARLVTLTGAGGIGKTRLAVHFAGVIATQFEHGAWFVDFATVKDNGEVLSAIATAVGAQEKEHELLIDTIVKALEGRATLLIFDNCEHVIEFAAAAATQLLQRLARVKLIATSREALAIDGEATYRVPSLHQVEAEELFVERASSITGTAAQTFDAELVRTICVQLDGIPMAVELAAGALRIMDVSDLAKHLHDRLGALAYGSRTAPSRHKTLRSLIDWSYELLDSNEQQMLRALSVFRGGFTAVAAAAIAHIDDDAAFAIVRRLEEKSLVTVVDADSKRYRLLETVRQYAAEKLAAKAETPNAKARHATYFCTLAQQVDKISSSAAVHDWLPIMLPERSNVEAAMQWGLEERHSPEIGARLAALLVRFLIEIGAEREAERWVQLALSMRCADERTLGWLYYGLARIAIIRGDHTAVKAAIEPALEIFERLSEDRGLAYARLAMGALLSETGNPASGKRYLQQSLQTFRNLGEKRSVIGVLTALGIALSFEEQFAQSRAAHEEVLTEAREIGSELLAAIALGNIAEIDFFEGKIDMAISNANEAIRYFAEHSSSAFLPVHQTSLASYYLERGEFAKAPALLHAALENLRLLPMGVAAANALDCVANLPSTLPETAMLLSGFADSFFESGSARDPVRERIHRKTITRLEGALGERKAAELRDEGRRLSMEAAIELASRVITASGVVAF